MIAPLNDDLYLYRAITNDTNGSFLMDSEVFLLFSYLIDGRHSEAAKPLYNLSFAANPWREDSNTPFTIIGIKTDGQRYTFFIKDQQPVTIDIGFNFFDRNPTQIVFRRLPRRKQSQN